MSEEIIKSETVFSGKLIKVRIDDVKLPSGRIARREIVVHRGAVAVVGTLEDEVLLIKQYRHAAGKFMWEIPAGTLEEGEDPLECAKRELLEETGYVADDLKKISQFYVAVGYCTEVIHLFIAGGLERAVSSPEEDENIEVRLVPIGEAINMIKSGQIEDAKTIIGILLLKNIMMEK